MPDDPISAKDYAQILRDMVKHENELTNQKLTWMSALNGFMLTGLGFVWGKPYDRHVITILCVLGIVISLSAYLSLRAAENARFYLNSLWRGKNISASEIPPVVGWTKAHRFVRWCLLWNVLPWALIVAWAILFVVNIARDH